MLLTLCVEVLDCVSHARADHLPVRFCPKRFGHGDTGWPHGDRRAEIPVCFTYAHDTATVAGLRAVRKKVVDAIGDSWGWLAANAPNPSKTFS